MAKESTESQQLDKANAQAKAALTQALERLAGLSSDDKMGGKFFPNGVTSIKVEVEIALSAESKVVLKVEAGGPESKRTLDTVSGDSHLADNAFTEAPLDPFPNPALAPTDAAGTQTNGARFGCSRNNGTKQHDGVDLKAAVGTSFKAIYSGDVLQIRDLPETDSDYKKDLGNYIIVRSRDLGFSIKYCHLSKINVKQGDRITQGQVIGKTGKSGNAYNVPFPHLHLVVSTDHFATSGNYVDPEPYLKTKYLPANPNPITCPKADTSLQENQGDRVNTSPAGSHRPDSV